MAAATDFASLRSEYARLWRFMEIDPARKASFDAAAKRLMLHIDKYRAVQKATGVPAAIVAVIHNRESNGDFSTYLGNGEPLNRVTQLVPKGRGPFLTWEEGAIDALRLQGTDKIMDWSLERACWFIEAYNGWGYRKFHPSTLSPYLWAGTGHYRAGKYTADGAFDATVADKQLGAVPLMLCLFERDVSLALSLSEPTSRPPPDIEPPPASKPAPAGSSGPSAAVGAGGLVAAGLAYAAGNPWIFIGGIVLMLGIFVAVAFLRKD